MPQAQVLQPNTVVAIAKPVHNVTEIELHTEPRQAQCQGLGPEMDEKELPEPLQELVERCSANLNEERGIRTR